MAGGLLGLTQNVNKSQSAREDLNTMEKMLAQKEFEQSQEQQAEMMYQETLTKVQDQADLLLENDKVTIQNKAVQLQQNIRRKIKAFGGSKKDFLKNGGISDLAQYRRDIINSNEFKGFKENKMNMERILMVKEKGLGHLLNDNDLNALNSYNANGSGKIQYTGLLNDVKIDPTLFEYGSQISPEEVLAAGDNRMKIKANYETDTGLVYTGSPEDDRKLHDYIRYKGYTTMGKNTAMLQARLASERLKAKAKKDAAIYTTAGSIQQANAYMGTKGYDNMSFAESFGSDKFATQRAKLGIKPNNNISYTPSGLFKNATKAISTPVRALGKKVLGKDNAGRYLDKGEAYRLKGGAEFGPKGKASEIMKEFLFNVETDSKGSYTVDPTAMEGTYDAKGSKLTNRTTVRGWGNSYKPMEMSFAFRGKDNNGQDMLVVEALDKKTQKDLYGDKAPEGEGTMVIRMHDPENPGFDYYQEIDSQSTLANKALGDLFGDDNDLTETTVEEQQAGANVATANQMATNFEKGKVAVEKYADETAIYSLKKTDNAPVFDGFAFNEMMKKYNGPNNNLTRNMLAKSFYQALAQGDEDYLNTSVDKKALDLALEQFDLLETMRNEKVDDMQIMDKYKTADKDTFFYELWKSIYTKNIENVTKR